MITTNYYELVEMISDNPIIKKYGLDPEVVVMFALVLDKYVHTSERFTTSANHSSYPRIRLGSGNLSVTKFAKILSKGMGDMKSVV